MIPSDPKELEKLQELADRNIANDDWGTETTVPGLPGHMEPMTPEEHAAKGPVTKILAKVGKQRVPKRQ